MPTDGRPRSATAPISPLPEAEPTADPHRPHPSPSPQPQPLQETMIGRRGQLTSPYHPLGLPGAPRSPRDPGPLTCRAGSAGGRTPPRRQLGSRAHPHPCPTRRRTMTSPRTAAPNREDRPTAPSSTTIPCRITPSRAGALSTGPRRPSHPTDGCHRRRPFRPRPTCPPSIETSSRTATIRTASIRTATSSLATIPTAMISTAASTGPNTADRRRVPTASRSMTSIRNRVHTPGVSPDRRPVQASATKPHPVLSPAGRGHLLRCRRRHRNPSSGSHPKRPSRFGSPPLLRDHPSSDMPLRPI